VKSAATTAPDWFGMVTSGPIRVKEWTMDDLCIVPVDPRHGGPGAQLAQLSVEICLLELRKGDRTLDTD
jgi:hypothetical protein